MVALCCGDVRELKFNFVTKTWVCPCCGKPIYSLITNTYNPEVVNGNSKSKHL